jgi:hypothetical protein
MNKSLLEKTPGFLLPVWGILNIDNLLIEHYKGTFGLQEI